MAKLPMFSSGFLKSEREIAADNGMHTLAIQNRYQTVIKTRIKHTKFQALDRAVKIPVELFKQVKFCGLQTPPLCQQEIEADTFEVYLSHKSWNGNVS